MVIVKKHSKEGSYQLGQAKVVKPGKGKKASPPSKPQKLSIVFQVNESGGLAN